jgi:hypothetical protein
VIIMNMKQILSASSRWRWIAAGGTGILLVVVAVFAIGQYAGGLHPHL